MAEEEIEADDIELLSENIEYNKKLNFDIIIFRHIDRTNKMLALGEPEAYGNCVAGLIAMLEWYFDDTCIKKLNKLTEEFNARIKAIVTDKKELSPTEKMLFNKAEFDFVIGKFSIIIDLLGRRAKLWASL